MLESELDSVFSEFDAPAPILGTPPRKYRSARIAFADLNFSWPPNGGADIDLYHVALGLQAAGHIVHVFVAHEDGSTDRGIVNPAQMPFKTTVIDFTESTLRAEAIESRFRDAITAWQPEIVFVTHGYALKTALLRGLRGFKTIARYYAHELACARDPLRYRDGAPCPDDFLRTPEVCRRCALAGQAEVIRHGERRTWTADYLAARAYAPEFHAETLAALRSARVVIVSNRQMQEHLHGFHPDVRILPGGVNARAMSAKPAPAKRPDGRKILFMAGRVDDPLKGLRVLLNAGHRLYQRRKDFEIWATHFDYAKSSGWFRAVGWHDPAGMAKLYAEADICVAPSIWDEPFGLVAVEAMAVARPVVAARVGGLQDIVLHGETGFLFDRGDDEALADALMALIEQPELRARMGARARAVVERSYDWDVIIRERYLPLIEELLE